MSFLSVKMGLHTGTLQLIGAIYQEKGHSPLKIDSIEVGDAEVREVRMSRYIHTHLKNCLGKNCTIGILYSLGSPTLVALKNEEGKFYKNPFSDILLTDRLFFALAGTGFLLMLFTFGISLALIPYAIYNCYTRSKSVSIKVKSS